MERPNFYNRRDVLGMCVAGVSVSTGLAMTTTACTQAKADAPPNTSSSNEDALDEALQAIHRREPRSGAGLSTHAPMAIEALAALGHGSRISAWLEASREVDRDIPLPSRPIIRTSFREAMGPKRNAASWEQQLERWGDWRVFFEKELAESKWPDILDVWTRTLAPGICAAALHGVIRTAHAARALSRRSNAPRLAELARGLAYWAVAYEELPAQETPTNRVRGYAAALEQLPLFTEARGGVPAGNIVSGLRAAATLEGMERAMFRVEPRQDVDAAVTELTATFAHEYLRHGAGGPSITKIAFLHAITGACALRRIAKHIKPETARYVLPYVWQAGAFVYAAYAQKTAPAPKLDTSVSAESMILHAIERNDAHALKLTEAVLDEYTRNANPVYLAAAADASTTL